MRKPVNGVMGGNNGAATYRDESVEAKWNELRDYERNFEAGLPVTGAGSGIGARQDSNASIKSNLSAKEKFQQFRKNSGQKLAVVRNQLAGRYRKGEFRSAGYNNGEVNSSPSGVEPVRPGSVSLSNLGAVGRGIKSSKSLQNLEQITKDGLRQVADKTSYIGQNIKHRCSSKVDLNQLAPKRLYEELNDAESDDDSHIRRDNLF